MEYLKPIEALQESVKRSQKIVYSLCALLGLSIVLVPAVLSSGPFVIVDDQSIHRMLKAKPWDVSISRLEAFTKQYLSSRFELDSESFSKKETALKSLTDENVFKKLKPSMLSFQSLIQNQRGKCFFTFESFGFSNSEKKIEAHITRVLRVGAMAAATPLLIQLTYRESSVNESNPYGLQIVSVEEKEIHGDSTERKQE